TVYCKTPDAKTTWGTTLGLASVARWPQGPSKPNAQPQKVGRLHLRLRTGSLLGLRLRDLEAPLLRGLELRVRVAIRLQAFRREEHAAFTPGVDRRGHDAQDALARHQVGRRRHVGLARAQGRFAAHEHHHGPLV